MPQRKKTRRVDASAVQGEGAYVDVRSMRYGETADLQEEGDTLTPHELNEVNIKLIQDKIAGWNWADENGEPLPLPATSEDVVRQLTIEEFGFLVKAITRGDPNDASE